jgi:hypothetical protein
MAHQATPAFQRLLDPGARRPPVRFELNLEGAVAERREDNEEPRRSIGRAVVAEFPVTHRPPHLLKPGFRLWAVLVHDLPGLLVGFRVVPPALQRGQHPKRRPRDIRTARHHLEREDQRVAPEQRMEPTRVVAVDWKRGRVRPAVVGQDRRRPRFVSSHRFYPGRFRRRRLTSRKLTPSAVALLEWTTTGAVA